MPPPFNSWCRRHLFNVVRKIDYGLTAIKKPDEIVATYDKQTLLHQFDECLHSRIAYGKQDTVPKRKSIHRILKRIRSWWYGHG